VINKIKKQFFDLRDELKRVDWPTAEKVRSATLAVVTVSAFVGVFFWGVDWLLARGVGFIIPHR
jgi:preprotein translocase SecE subunit